MKAKMFKIAGVKNEKEFYKKFPTEAAFMKKHGKDFMKKHMKGPMKGSMKSHMKSQDGDFNTVKDIEGTNDVLFNDSVALTPEGQSAMFDREYKAIDQPYAGKYGAEYGNKEGIATKGSGYVNYVDDQFEFTDRYKLGKSNKRVYMDNIAKLPENEGRDVYFKDAPSNSKYAKPKNYNPTKRVALSEKKKDYTPIPEAQGGIMDMVGGLMGGAGGAGGGVDAGAVGGALDAVGGVVGGLMGGPDKVTPPPPGGTAGSKVFKIQNGYTEIPKAQGGMMDMVGGLMGGAGGGMMDKIPGVGGMLGGATDIMGGLSGIMEQKGVIKESEQEKQLTTLNKDVMAMGDEKVERDYVRPEDIQNTGEEFFPIYGVGTNVLQKGGMVSYGQNGDIDTRQRAISKRRATQMTNLQKAQYGVLPAKGMFKAQWGPPIEDPTAVQQNESQQTTDPITPIEDPTAQAVGQQTEASGKKTIGQKMGNWLGESAGGPSGPGAAPKNDAGDVVAEAQASKGQFAAEAAGGVAGMLGQTKSAGGQLGKGIGTLAGKLIPIPGIDKITGMAGEVIGGMLDKDAKTIAKNQKAIDTNMNQMSGMAVGKGVQASNSSVMQDGSINAPMYRSGGQGRPLSTLKMYEDFAKAQQGGSLPGDMEGKLQTHWGGDTETVSKNPFLPGGGETIEFKGDMHNASNVPGESGIGVSYGGNPIEVEGGEQATRLQDGGGNENLVVYGNLTVSKEHAEEMGMPKAAGKKAKNYAKDISKREDSANKALKKNMKDSEELIPLTSFDKLKQASYRANINGNTTKLKNAAQEKKNLSQWQDAVNATAQDLGVEANALAKGRYKVDKGVFTPSNQAKNGGMYKAQDGVNTITKAQIKEYADMGYVMVTPPSGDRKMVKYGEDGKILHSYKVDGGKSNVSIKGILEDENLYKTFHSRMKGASDKEKKAAASKLFYDREMPEQWKKGTPKKEVYVKQEPIVGNSVGISAPNVGDFSGEYEEPSYTQFTPEEKSKPDVVSNIFQGVSATLPFWRPSDKDRFDYDQINGELFAMSNNALDPVKAQKFTPQLDVPYDISLQDQRNDISSATNAARRSGGQYNPAVMANIAAQEYEALNKLNAEEFRMNQAKKDQVYSGNRRVVDDANMKNLGILDQQYVRQTQAKSNTKEAKQAALNSISSKMQQHKLENKELGIYENMYNYRFGENDRAFNWNGPANYNMEGRDIQMTPEQAKVEARRMQGARAADIKNNSPVVKSQNGRKIALTRALKGY